MTAIIKKTRCPYPIGALIELTVGANPNTFWQGTTWAVHGTGRATIAIDAGQAEFDALAKTGGAKTHTLTIDEMPNHDHTIGGAFNTATGGGGSLFAATGQINTGFTGGGQAHNNLPPFVVVARWERTA